MASETVQVRSVDSQVVMLTLNRPEKRNALSMELLETLRDAIRHASGEAGRRVIIIAGAGTAFCAGLDLKEASTQTGERPATLLKEVYEAIVTSPLVTIAAAQGAAMGGGAGLLAACDLAVAADNLQLAFPEVRRGLVAALVTALIRRQVGDRTARELILLGRTIDAHEARRLGLVNETVAPARLDNRVISMAREACTGAPGAIQRTKQLLDELSPRPVTDDLDRAMKYHLDARHSDEATEGIAAFLAKRPPRWSVPDR